MAEDQNAAAKANEVKAPAETAAEESQAVENSDEVKAEVTMEAVREQSKAAVNSDEVKAEVASEVAPGESKAAENSDEVKAEVAAEGVAKDSPAAEKFAEVKAEVTPEATPTLRQIFELPEKEADPSDDRWQAFQEKVGKEIKSIKWTATVPDLAPKVCELLDIKIPSLLTAAWKKVADIQAVMEKSKKTPDETIYLELAQHTINSDHKPSIDVKIKGATVKKIELAIQLGFNLKGFLLKIQNGAITEMQTGQCEAKGTIKYGGLTVAEKKLQPIKLPFSIPMSALFSPTPEPEEEQAPITEAEENVTGAEEAKADELERIEL